MALKPKAWTEDEEMDDDEFGDDDDEFDEDEDEEDLEDDSDFA